MPKNTQNVVFRDDGCILVKNVRLSYPHLFEKWGKEGDGKKKYSAKFHLDKKTHAADIKALGAHITEFMTTAFKGRIPNDKLFLKDGANEGKDELKDVFLLSASEDKAPDVINRDKSRINENDDIVYAGCYVNVLIRPWAQNNQYGKRVNANLLAVQFVRDGEPFSSIERPDVDEAFDDVSEDFEDGGETGSDEDDPFS
jgi:hypothetical protein